jgi:hypothetical protein
LVVLRTFCRRLGRLGVVLVASLIVAAPPIAAQITDQAISAAAREVTADQNAIIRQYQRPHTPPPSLRLSVRAPVAGVPPERLAETRFRLTGIDIERA